MISNGGGICGLCWIWRLGLACVMHGAFFLPATISQLNSYLHGSKAPDSSVFTQSGSMSMSDLSSSSSFALSYLRIKRRIRTSSMIFFVHDG